MEASRDLLSRFDNFLLDIDGVLWKAGHLLPHTKETLAYLKAAGKNIVYVTNSSTQSRRDCVPKFEKFGLEASVGDIVTSTFAVSEFLRLEKPHVKVAFVIGCAGLCDEVRAAGVRVIEGSMIPQIKTEPEFANLEVDPSIQAVIVGYDYGINYAKICYASLCLQKIKNCTFIGTSRDVFDQFVDRRLPGMTATAVYSIETSSGVTPSILGKPSKWLMEYLLRERGLDPTRTCMVGDRLDSDIAFGKTGPVTTILVLTGCTQKKDLEKSEIVPDVVMDCFGDLLPKHHLVPFSKL